MVIAEKDKDGNFLAKKVDSSGYFNPKEMTYTEMSGPQPYLKHASFNANCNPYIIPYLPKSILTVQMYPTLDPFDSFQFGSGFTIEERPVWQDPRPASSSRTNEVSRVVASDEHSLLISNNKSIRTSNPNSPTPSQMALDPLCCDSFFSGRMPTKHVLVHKGVVLATLLDPGPLRYDVSNTAQSRYRGRRSTISRANSTASTTSPPTLIIDGVMGSVCYGNISPGKSSNAANGTNSNSPKRKDKNKEDSAALRKAEAMRQAIIAQNNARRREIISFQMQMQQQKQRTSSVLKLQLNEKATGDTVIQIVRALQFLNNSLMPVESPRDIVVGLSLFTPVSLSTGTLTNWTPSLPGSHFCGGTGAIAMTLATVPSANEKVKALSVHSFATVTIDLERTDDPVVIDLWMDTVGHHFPHPIPAAHQCFVPECKGEDCYIGSIGLVYNSKFTTFTGGYLNIAVSEGYNKDKEYIDFKPKTEGVYDEAPLDLNALDHMNIENDSTKDRLSLEGDQVFYGDKLVAILDRRAGEKNNFHDPERSTSYCSTIIRNKQRPLSLSSLNTPKRLHKSGNQKRCDTLEQSSPYMVGSTLDLNSISEGGKLTFYFIKKDDRYEGLPDSDVSSEFGEKSLAVTLEGFKTKQAAHNRSTDNITYGNMRHQRRPSTTSSSDFQSVCVSDLVEPSCLVIPPGYVPVECSLEIVQEIIRNVTFSSRVLTSSDNNYMNSDVPLTSTVTGERSIVYELSCGSCKPVYAHTKLKQSGPLITITSKETYMTHGENAGPCPILKDVNTSNDEGWDGGFVVLECVKGFNHLTDTLSLISEEKGSGKGISLIKKTKLVEPRDHPQEI